MQSALISYFKRYRMEIGLAGLPPPARTGAPRRRRRTILAVTGVAAVAYFSLNRFSAAPKTSKPAPIDRDAIASSTKKLTSGN